MNTKCFVSRPAAFAPLGIGVLRSLRVEFHPICDGRELMSPDERFIARAMSTYGPRVSGGAGSCYEFAVEDRAGRRIQHVEVPMPRDDLINWRLEGSVVWADDSSSVTFEFKRTCLILSIDHE